MKYLWRSGLRLVAGLRLTALVDQQRRRLGCHEIVELATELARGQSDRRGELRELVWIVEVIAPETNHVSPRHGVPRRGDIHQPDVPSAPVDVHHLRESDEHEMAAVQ